MAHPCRKEPFTMNTLRGSMLFATLIATLCACSADDRSFDERAATSRNEARLMGGRADSGLDLCDEHGWYDDGICDDFCPRHDDDCESCPSIIKFHSCFTTNILTCPEGTSEVVDPSGCGCGCTIDDESLACPSASDSSVEYHSCFTTDVWECEAGWVAIIDPDGCGCYCQRSAETCPAASDVIYHSCFATDVFECPAGSSWVIDPNGCGCYCE